MKDFLIMNIEENVTRYFTIENIPMAKAKAKQLSWKNDLTIVCSLIDGFYEPTLNVKSCRLKAFDAYHVFDRYLKLYHKARTHLPANFLYAGRLRTI